MPANARSRYGAAPGGSSLIGEANKAGLSDSRERLLMPDADAHVRAGINPLVEARALLIFLRHRGVLNVEEFRRTRTRDTHGTDAIIRSQGG